MKNIQNKRTAYENLLHKNRVSYRAAGQRIGCSGEYVRQLAVGLKPATGKVGLAFNDLMNSLKGTPIRQASLVSPDANSPSIVPPAIDGGLLASEGRTT